MRTQKEVQAKQEVKKAICDAVWKGEVNQEYTSEVAKRFGCSTWDAFDILMDIVNGDSGDERFTVNEEIGGVFIAKGVYGATFTHSELEGSSHNSRNDVRHTREYCWFLT